MKYVEFICRIRCHLQATQRAALEITGQTNSTREDIPKYAETKPLYHGANFSAALRGMPLSAKLLEEVAPAQSYGTENDSLLTLSEWNDDPDAQI